MPVVQFSPKICSAAAVALALAAPALASTPAAHAAPKDCVPQGAERFFAQDPAMRLYRYVWGPVTACWVDGRAPVELGGWQDRPKAAAQPGMKTRVFSSGGNCVALLGVTFTDDDHGDGSITAFDVSKKTTWPLGQGRATFVYDSAGGGWASDFAGPPAFAADCAATWTSDAANGPMSTPPGTNPITVPTGIRPRLKSAPQLTLGKNRTLHLKLKFDRKPRGTTIVFGGVATVLVSRPASMGTTLRAGSHAPVRRNRTYALTVTACKEGCTTRAYRVKVR